MCRFGARHQHKSRRRSTSNRACANHLSHLGIYLFIRACISRRRVASSSCPRARFCVLSRSGGRCIHVGACGWSRQSVRTTRALPVHLLQELFQDLLRLMDLGHNSIRLATKPDFCTGTWQFYSSFYMSTHMTARAYASLRYTLTEQLSMVVLHLLVVNQTTLVRL
jgi:hypothetical protein